MFRDSLYFVEELAPTLGHAIIKLNPEDVIFKAHFPGNPILPGVCIAAIAAEVFSALASLPAVKVTEIRNAKFIAVIDPRENLRLRIDFGTPIGQSSSEARNIKAVVTDSDGDKVFARISMTIEPAE